MPNEIDLSAGLLEPSKSRRARSNYDTSSALDLIAHHESGGRNIKQQIVPEGGGYNPSVGRVTGPSTASGPWQITNTTWRRRAPREVSQRYPTAMSAPIEVQRSVAGKMFEETGFNDWAPYNAGLRRAIGQGERIRPQSNQIDLSAGLESSPQSPAEIDLSAGLEAPAAPIAPQSPAAPTKNRFAAMARIAQQPVSGVRGRPAVATATLDRGSNLGALRQFEDQQAREVADIGMGRLRQMDEPEVARVQRVQSDIRRQQEQGQQALRTAPTSAQARTFDPRLDETQETIRRLTTERDEEKRLADARAETQRVLSQFTDADRAEIADFVNHLQGKGRNYAGARAGIRRGGSTALRALAGLADVGNAVAKRTVGESWIPDYLRKKALAGDLSVDDIPIEKRNQVAEFLAEAGVGLATLAAAPGKSAVTKFAGLAGAEAIGRNLPAREVVKETVKGGAMGAVQKYGEMLAPATGNYARRLAVSGPAVGLGSGAVELATGATPREALMSTVTNAAFQGLGEVGRGRRARPVETRSTTTAMPVESRFKTYDEVRDHLHALPDSERLAYQQAERSAPEMREVFDTYFNASDAQLAAATARREQAGVEFAQKYFKEKADVLPTETQPGVPAQSETVGSTAATAKAALVRPVSEISVNERPISGRERGATDAGNVRAGEGAADSAPAAGRLANNQPATVDAPRRWLHADFGEVTEAPNQRKAGRGRVKVIDAKGDTHYIKASDLSGRGNQRAIPLKEPTRESVTEAVTEVSNLESGLERRSPERVPQTDWLAMSDTERAQIRREVDLEQQNPVAPKPAQVDILTPREGEQLQEPIRQSVTEPITEAKPPESTTSARKSQLAQDRADLDLPELPAPERKSWQQSLSEAKPERAGLLADEVLSRPRSLNDSETASLVVRAQEIKNDHARTLEEIGATKDADVIEQKRAELASMEREFDKLTEATKRSGTEKGRSLVAQKLTINQDFDLISMKNRVKADKGAPLTEKENAQIEELHAKLAKAEAERDAANERAAQAQLQKEINKIAQRGTRRRERTETRQSLDTEFADLKTQFAQARAEISGIQPSGLAGLDPEGKLTKIIAKMARNRVKAGVTDAAQLVDDIFAAVSDSVEGLTRRDVRDAISGYGLERGDRRSPEAKQLAAIRAELQSLSKTEDIASGQRSSRQEGPQRDFRKDQQRRAQLEKQEADLLRRMAEGDFSKQERVPPTYTRETYAKQRVVDQLKADFEKMRYRATRSTGGKIADTAIGMANVPKTFLSMGDLSALLRQGGVGFVQHPVLSTRAAHDMLKSLSAHGFANVENAIKASPEFELAKRSGVEFTGIDKDDPRLNRREEGYLGSGAIDTLAKGKLNPLRAVKAIKDVSERTFVSFLDSQRMRIFEQQAQALRDMKLTGKELDAALKSQARYINTITGRGSLGERGNQYAPALNLAMFSPRLVASRFQLLNKMLNPVAWARTPKGARKLQLIDNAKFLVGTATVLGLAKAAGADVNLDPDDSEFLKIKIGNTRYDTLTGLQQPMRFMLRLSSAIKADITGDETYAGGDKGDIVADFARSKASPELGLGIDYLAGGNRLTGEKFSLGKNLREAVTPLPVQEFMEAAKTDGKLRGTIETLPSLLGIGVQTYKSGEKATTHAEKLARKFMRAKMPDEFRDQEAIDIDAKKSDLRARSRRGEDVRVDLKALGAKITERQAKNILNARSKTRLQEDFSRLGVKDASLVYSVATPTQQVELKPLMQRKVFLVNALPLDQQPAVKSRLKSLGVMR